MHLRPRWKMPGGLSFILSSGEPAGHEDSAARRSPAGPGPVEFAGRDGSWAALAERLYALDASVWTLLCRCRAPASSVLRALPQMARSNLTAGHFDPVDPGGLDPWAWHHPAA